MGTGLSYSPPRFFRYPTSIPIRSTSRATEARWTVVMPIIVFPNGNIVIDILSLGD